MDSRVDPNDPASGRPSAFKLPGPRLSPVYRLEAALGEPLDLGGTAQGRRRVVALTGGTFTGPQLSGRLLPGASADWQIVLPDGTALADLRYAVSHRCCRPVIRGSRSARGGVGSPTVDLRSSARGR